MLTNSHVVQGAASLTAMLATQQVAFHSLYRDGNTGEIECHTTCSYLDIHPNAIAETFDDLYDREIERTLGVSAQ